jgi:hypothetical protein
LDRLKYYLFYKPWKEFDLAVLADDSLRSIIQVDDKDYTSKIVNLGRKIGADYKAAKNKIDQSVTVFNCAKSLVNISKQVYADAIRVTEEKIDVEFKKRSRLLDERERDRLVDYGLDELLEMNVEHIVKQKEAECGLDKEMKKLDRGLSKLDKKLEESKTKSEDLDVRLRTYQTELDTISDLKDEVITRQAAHYTEYSKDGIYGGAVYKLGQALKKYGERKLRKIQDSRLGRTEVFRTKLRDHIGIEGITIGCPEQMIEVEARIKKRAEKDAKKLEEILQKRTAQYENSKRIVEENVARYKAQNEAKYNERIAIIEKMKTSEKSTVYERLTERMYEGLIGMGNKITGWIDNKDKRRTEFISSLKDYLGNRLRFFEKQTTFF